ncbi:MAG: hypothetical protein IJ767_04040 [Bacteroidaceae bacterium]|nr:hypothetical protein [Bacteroidaceae bacterium]
MGITIILMLAAFFFGVLIDHAVVKEECRRRIREIMRRQKEDPTWYEAKSDANTIGAMLEDRAQMYLPTLGVAFPDKQKIAANVFHETFTYAWLRNFCDIVRQCACTLYIKPNDGPALSVDDIRGGKAPRTF